MQSIGALLERIGPVFAGLMFFLVIACMVTMLVMSLVRLGRRERPGTT